MTNAEATPAAARVGMLVRRPLAEVFAAFVDPAVTTQFWFTKSSGRLEPGKTVTWSWEMYGASTEIRVKTFEANRRLVIEWDGYTGRNTVEWKFAAHSDTTTFVSVSETGWTSSGAELLSHVASATEGFTLTLAGCKAWLEHGLRLNLVGDRFPQGPEHPFPDE